MKPSINSTNRFKYPFIATMIALLFFSYSITTVAEQSLKDLDGRAVADRVVVAINNIPYSQNQVEAYIDVKESLRDDAVKSQTVNESNWSQALDVFSRDMAIHQEASKSSGFRPTKEAIQKLRLRSDNTINTANQFKSAFERLGITGSRIDIEILKIATVENFRRGKQSLNNKDKDGNWEKDLSDRTTIRLFDDAKIWKQTSPKP